MSRWTRNLVGGVKYALYGVAATAVGAVCFLQYANYQLGPIDIDPVDCARHYE